jgi:hypothetical protein
MEVFSAMKEVRRAKDFVKCVDPECWINKDWAAMIARAQARYERTPLAQPPHCHPVFEDAP